MDWNLRTPWEFNEYELKTVPNIGLGNQWINGDFSVDLKLGQVIDSGSELADNLKVPSVSKMAASPLRSSKRARAISNGIQIVSCLVDGCNRDLSNCREYHRRHKVCELHSKTPQVTINGNKQRFCQQCSRFHSLEEFDEGKRSCRKRLDGHNRRRRKPQPGSLPQAGRLFSDHQGIRLSFSSSQLCPTTLVANPAWAGAVTVGEGARFFYQLSHSDQPDKLNPYPESLLSSTKGGRQISFLQSTNLALCNKEAPQDSVCQPLLTTFAAVESGGRSFCDGLPTQAVNSDCVLSLLSSSPTQTFGIGLSDVMYPNSIPTRRPFGPSVHHNGPEPVNSVLVSNASHSDVHSLGLFHMGPDASPDNGTPETLPFYWE